jgi:hypothetical protein
MSFVDKAQLEPGCTILLHNKVRALWRVLRGCLAARAVPVGGHMHQWPKALMCLSQVYAGALPPVCPAWHGFVAKLPQGAGADGGHAVRAGALSGGHPPG